MVLNVSEGRFAVGSKRHYPAGDVDRHILVGTMGFDRGVSHVRPFVTICKWFSAALAQCRQLVATSFLYI
jgi:hypothetical protein